MYPCPCCGYLIFDDPPGSFDICVICFWEDDLVQLGFPDMAGGANKCSLIEGQANFARIGVREARLLRHVRPPGPEDVRDDSWQPLDPARDRYLHWTNPADHDTWDNVKSTKICLYYWKPDYWLAQGK